MTNKNPVYSRTTGSRGIAIIEVMILVLVILTLASLAVPVFLNRSSANRNNITWKKIQAIKAAIIGYPEKMINRSRQNFMFIGDIGVLPGSLDELMIQGSYQGYHLEQNLWFGWRGPYLDNNMVNGSYSAFIDAWGRPIQYNDSAPPSLKELRSMGEDGQPGTSDDIFILIVEDEVKTHIEGSFLERVSKSIMTGYSATLNINYPNGAAGLATLSVPVQAGQFSTQPGGVKIPVGVRYFITVDTEHKKLFTLNNGGLIQANFYITDPGLPSGPDFQRSFDDNDNPGDNPLTFKTGTWSASDGNLYASGSGGEHLAVFGYPGWRDYRVEVNATLKQGSGYGIYYRTDGDSNITGYVFQYNPGLYSQGVEFVIRKVYRGDENYFPGASGFLARIRMTSDEFNSRFGNSIFNDSHQISITVKDTRHIIKVDGQELLDVSDSEPLFPCGGLCGMPGLGSWDGNQYTAFHSIRVYGIPPLPDKKTVWWSFEEGNQNRVYGSGFLIDGAENNGIFTDAVRIDSGIYGSALEFFNQLNYLSIPDHPNIDLTSEGTITAWIKAREITKWAGIIHKGAETDQSDEAFSLQFWSNKKIVLRLRDQAGQAKTLFTAKRFSDEDLDTWIFIAATWGPQGMMIYINGVVDNFNADIVNVRNSSGNLNIGAQFAAQISNKDKNYPFVGILDEISLYQKQLTAGQILLLFDKFKNNR